MKDKDVKAEIEALRKRVEKLEIRIVQNSAATRAQRVPDAAKVEHRPILSNRPGS